MDVVEQTFGWMGSTNDQMRINEGVVVVLLSSSIRSSKPCPAASDTAMIPRKVGCHWTHVTILSRDCLIDENDWYSFRKKANSVEIYEFQSILLWDVNHLVHLNPQYHLRVHSNRDKMDRVWYFVAELL